MPSTNAHPRPIPLVLPLLFAALACGPEPTDTELEETSAAVGLPAPAGAAFQAATVKIFDPAHPGQYCTGFNLYENPDRQRAYAVTSAACVASKSPAQLRVQVRRDASALPWTLAVQEVFVHPIHLATGNPDAPALIAYGTFVRREGSISSQLRYYPIDQGGIDRDYTFLGDTRMMGYLFGYGASLGEHVTGPGVSMLSANPGGVPARFAIFLNRADASTTAASDMHPGDQGAPALCDRLVGGVRVAGSLLGGSADLMIGNLRYGVCAMLIRRGPVGAFGEVHVDAIEVAPFERWFATVHGDVCSGSTCTTPCSPLTCAETGCGEHGDGCGGVMDCGACCVPRTCAQVPNECGLHDDGCGASLDCGRCPTRFKEPSEDPAVCDGYRICLR